MWITSLIINITHQNGAFVINDKHTLTHNYHPKSVDCLRVYFAVVHSVGLNKYIIRCIHYYNKKYFYCLKNAPCSTCVPLLRLPHLWQPLTFLWSPEFCLFQKVSTVVIIQYIVFSYWLISLSNIHLSFLHIFSWLYFFFMRTFRIYCLNSFHMFHIAVII